MYVKKEERWGGSCICIYVMFTHLPLCQTYMFMNVKHVCMVCLIKCKVSLKADMRLR